MDNSVLLSGRPYGGCSIVYRKSLSSSITPLCTNSNRFCAVKLREFSGSSVLLMSVYLPSDSVVSSFSDYLNTLGELEGFIESQHCDFTHVAGDFNVDFDRGGPLASLLEDFACEQNFVMCDLSYRESVKFTYERDGGLVPSWIDHVVCSESLSSRITDVHSVSSGANMSDHLPLSFQLHIPCSSINTLPSSVSSKPKACINWSKVTPSTVMMYQQMVLGKLADPPVEFLQCSSPSCSVHASLLDNYASHFVSTLLDSASSCFPCHSASKQRVPGWNESAGKPKELSIFWNRVWTEAGCPSAGVLSTIPFC